MRNIQRGDRIAVGTLDIRQLKHIRLIHEACVVSATCDESFWISGKEFVALTSDLLLPVSGVRLPARSTDENLKLKIGAN